MNKQEIDNLIANNSIRQTNRQWLESLSDEEFSRYCCSMAFERKCCVDCMSRNSIEKRETCVILGGWNEYFDGCMLEWLQAEHKED